ncbi:PRC-barrel domain-containing protein [Caenispirillum salinarum]|uniref:PRC-barrel domain-containing protein n=1 Tax=Caenispirillum salinarum TaxID=859058 RepID=UPI00384DEAA5
MRHTPRLLAAAAVVLAASATGCGGEGGAPDPAKMAAKAPAPIDAKVLRAVEPGETSVVWPAGWERADEDVFRDLAGFDVYGPGEEQVGEIEAVLVDAENRVVGFVVDTEGLLGIGGREVIVPLERLEIGPQNDTFITGMTEDELEALPQWEAY